VVATEGEKHALTVLARLASRCPQETARIQQILEERLDRLGQVAIEVALENEGPMGVALAGAVQRSATPELARKLSESIPQSTIALLDTAVVLEKRAYETFDRSGGAGVAFERAARLMALSERLDNQGRLEEAIAAISDAISLARQAFNANELLAACLDVMAKLSVKSGRVASAFKYSDEAEKLWSSLNPKNAPKARFNRTSGLIAKSDRLAALGQFQDALTAATDAVNAYETSPVPADRMARYNYAGALNTKSARLQQLNRTSEAIDNSRRSLSIYRDLYEQYPDEFQPSYVQALNRLSAFLVSDDKLAEARSNIEEAESIVRKLAADRPYTFDSSLAAVLFHKTQMLQLAKEPAAAQAASDEARTILRRLAAELPDRFTPQLAELYEILGRQHSDAGEIAQAERAFEAAVLLQGPRFLQLPGRWFQPIARAITGYFDCVQKQDKTEISRLMGFMIDTVNEVRVGLEKAGPNDAVFRFDLVAKVHEFIFTEMIEASTRFPEEPVVRQTAASAGFHAISTFVAEKDFESAKKLLTRLGELSASYPEDAYIAEEYATSLRNFSKDCRESGALDEALSAWSSLERLAAEHPTLPRVRIELAEATYPLTGLIDLSEGRRLLASVQALAVAHPAEDQLRICAVKASTNVLQLEMPDADLARTAYEWVEYQVIRYPSSILRGLLALISFNYLNWLQHRGSLDAAAEIFGRLQELSGRFSDEADVLAGAAHAHSSLVAAYVRARRIDEAKQCFEGYCRGMQVTRECRLSRAMAIHSLALGSAIAKRNFDASRYIELLLRAVKLENGDPEFVGIARKLKDVMGFTAEIPGEHETAQSEGADGAVKLGTLVKYELREPPAG